MKKFLTLMLLMSIGLTLPLQSQGLLNKVKKAVTKEISGITGNDRNNAATEPEPSCACDDAEFIIDLAKYNLDYKEISLTTAMDGSLLIKDRINSKYYILKNGQMQGPINENDSRLSAFYAVSESSDDDDNDGKFEKIYPGIVTVSGDKYLIKFNGKSYGPYALIQDFAISASGTKFAAVVTENMIMNEAQGKKMEEAMNNAKTDQERMELAMQMSQQMQNQVMKSGTASLQPKIVSNIPGAVYDPMTMGQGRLIGNAKPDDIIIETPNSILDLKGKKIMSVNDNPYLAERIFLNSSNTKYATYKSGTLTFSDNTRLSELFNPGLVSLNGSTYITYMYYSPSKFGIMQCKIQF